MRAAVETAQEMGSPVILAFIPPDIADDASLGYWYNSAIYAAKQVRVPVCLHLDHAADVALCKKCIDTGYQSVMIDASAKSFAENAGLAGEVVKLAHEAGICVEAELGHVASGITGAADGGSGTPADQLAEAIKHGIAKINIYSELTAAWNTAMRDFLNQRKEMTCWFSVVCAEPDKAMREAMREKFRMFNTAGKH